MFGACSSDDVVVDDQPGVATPGEKGYVNLSINLPTQPSSRANDVFDNGDEKEYNVNNAYLFLFKGANEASATFQSGYELTTGSWNDQANGSNITTYASIVQEITKPSITGNDKLYALVVLNGNGVITKGGTAEDPTFKYGSYDFTKGSTTLNDLTNTNALSGLDLSTVASVSGDGNFLMSNAPLFSKPGGATNPADGTVSTLAEVNPNLIYTEKAAAETGAAAANIYVERAVAKVTIANTSAENKTTVDGLDYTIAGWALDVTNNSTYLVRNVAPTTSWWSYYSSKSTPADYRFVGSSAVAANLYRTYWGVDPNYDGNNYGNEPFAIHSGETYTDDELTSFDNPLYCFENTFNAENMRQNQTTQVIVAADFNTKTDFYTLRGNKDKDSLFTRAAAESRIKAAYLNNKDIAAAIKGATMAESETKIEASDLTVTFDSEEGGYLTVTEIELTEDGVKKFKDSSVPAILTKGGDGHAAVVKIVSDDMRVAYYKGGRSYYHAMIQHFGDQTPWNASDVTGTDSYGTPANEADYLGRWGVLRNNWYQISVTGIAELGEPEVPSVPGSYDDPTESWIRVNINVLSWAVRTQNVGL